jgi:hypothetical protein
MPLKKALEKAVKAAKSAADNSKVVRSTKVAVENKRVMGKIKSGEIKPSTSKELVPTGRSVVPYKKPMGKVKKAAIATGVLSGLGALGNTEGTKTGSSSRAMSSGKSKPDTAMSNRYAAQAKMAAKNGTLKGGSSTSSSRQSGLSASGRSYTASKGDSLWSIAEKTVPKGESVSSWWLAIKKMNTQNGKLRRLYTGTGVSLPPGARRS